MYKNYGQRYGARNGGDQANKAIYDVRDNVESQTRRIAGLAKAIKQLHEYVGIIADVLQDRGCLSRSDFERKLAFSHASVSQKQVPVLQESDTCNESERIHVGERQRRHGVVSVHDKRQTSNAKIIAKRITYDASPPRGHSSDKAESDKEQK